MTRWTSTKFVQIMPQGPKFAPPQVSLETWPAFNMYLYVSFKQNSGERFRATWPSCSWFTISRKTIVRHDCATFARQSHDVLDVRENVVRRSMVINAWVTFALRRVYEPVRCPKHRLRASSAGRPCDHRTDLRASWPLRFCLTPHIDKLEKIVSQ